MFRVALPTLIVCFNRPKFWLRKNVFKARNGACIKKYKWLSLLIRECFNYLIFQVMNIQNSQLEPNTEDVNISFSVRMAI